MANSYIAVAPDSTGKKLQTFENTIAGQVVEAEAVTLVDSAGAELTVQADALTDTQLRATPVPVSGTVATGGLTDTQLRATPVPVSGTVTATTGGLTDTQLRASAVPVSLATVPSHAVTNAGTFAVQATGTVTSNPTAATTVASTALEASHVLKNSAGSLVSLSWLNSKTSSQYLLIMNSTTVPADGAVTLLCPPIFMPATSNGMLEFKNPLVASTGISVSNSSTGTFTKTIGSSDCIFTAQVI